VTSPEARIAANPFPGLRSFRPAESDRFFGREQQVSELEAQLKRSPFVTVAGASGCGKSSLVMAGLLHRLTGTGATNGDTGTRWRPVVLKPGNHPISRLADSLYPALRDEQDEMGTASLDGRLRLGNLGLVEAVKSAHLPPGTRILVVVDQFEEIFRFKRVADPEEAAAFVKLLLTAATDIGSPVNVVLTLRSDALGSCAEFRDLPESIARGQYLVPRLTREQRKDAIVGPIALRGFEVAPRLVQRVLNDVSDDFDDLPIMQHALTRTWCQWAHREPRQPVDLDDYEAVGGARNALSIHADEAYKSLNGTGDVAQRIFRALTERVSEETQNRRPLDFQRLCAVVGDPEPDVARVVNLFRSPETAFLLPPPEVGLEANPVIDISHESLIRQWGQLREWAKTEAESRSALLRVCDAAERYAQKKSDLWGGRELELALEWRDTVRPTDAWVTLCIDREGTEKWLAARTFLAKSEAATAREKRKKRWLRNAQIAAATLALVVSWSEAVLAVRMKRKTEALQRQSSSRALANQALLDFDIDPARSANLALAAVKRDPQGSAAAYALHQSVAALDVAHAEQIVSLGEPISEARLSRDRSRIVVAGYDKVWIFDGHSYAVGPPIEVEGLRNAWLVGDNKLLLTLGWNGGGRIRRIDKPGLDQRISCEGSAIYKMAVSPDDRFLAVGCNDGRASLWAISDERMSPVSLVCKPDGITVTALGFSTDGKYLAIGDADGHVRIWKIGTAAPWMQIARLAALGVGSGRAHGDAVRDVVFNPSDAEYLATASDDRTAVVWALDLQRRKLKPSGSGRARSASVLTHERPVLLVRFTPNPQTHVLATVSDKRIRFWDSESSTDARGGDDWVTNVDFSEDGELVVAPSDDGTARVWSTRHGSPIAVLRGHDDVVTSAFFMTHEQVVTASRDGTLRVWHLRPPSPVASRHGWIFNAEPDHSGKRSLVCGEGGCQIVSTSGDDHRADVALSDMGNDPIGRTSWSWDDGLVIAHGESEGISATYTPYVWESRTGRNVTPAWMKNIWIATFSPTNARLVTVGRDDGLALWDTAALSQSDPQPLWEAKPQKSRLDAVLSADGRWIAASQGDTVALFDLEGTAPTEPRLLKGHQGQIESLVFSDDSTRLLTASDDRTARIWTIDPPPGQSTRTLVLPAGGKLASAAFSRDGRQVIAGGAEGTIRVWDAQSGLSLAVQHWHSEAVNSVRFTRDGRILSASDDGTAKLGRCEACSQTIAQLSARVPREAPLTAADQAFIQRWTDATAE
jgi:WD40 repeat protein